jgi:hypothetical protein
MTRRFVELHISADAGVLSVTFPTAMQWRLQHLSSDSKIGSRPFRSCAALVGVVGKLRRNSRFSPRFR